MIEYRFVRRPSLEKLLRSLKSARRKILVPIKLRNINDLKAPTEEKLLVVTDLGNDKQLDHLWTFWGWLVEKTGKKRSFLRVNGVLIFNKKPFDSDTSRLTIKP